MRAHCHNIGCIHLDIGALPATARHVEVPANHHRWNCGSAKPCLRSGAASQPVIKRGDVIFRLCSFESPAVKGALGHGTSPHEIQPHRIPSTTLTWPTTDGSAGRASNTTPACHTLARAHTAAATQVTQPNMAKTAGVAHLRVVETVSTMHESGVPPAARTGVQPPPGPLGPPPAARGPPLPFDAARVSATGRLRLG